MGWRERLTQFRDYATHLGQRGIATRVGDVSDRGPAQAHGAPRFAWATGCHCAHHRQLLRRARVCGPCCDATETAACRLLFHIEAASKL